MVLTTLTSVATLDCRQVDMASGGMGSGPLGAGAGGGADALIQKARKFEQGNDYARAIEAYLGIGQGDTSNLDVLQQAWGQAASLAMSYQVGGGYSQGLIRQHG